jgi:hypothetical protein
MFAGAQMESEQRSLTTLGIHKYLRTHTNRAWLGWHYCFEKRVIGKHKIFVPRIERMIDVYQLDWMMRRGWNVWEAHTVMEKNRRCREGFKWPTFSNTDVCRHGPRQVGSSLKLVAQWPELMGNPHYGHLLPQIEEGFRQRWKHLPLGAPDWRGKGTGIPLFHLLHPSVKIFRGPNKGLPCCIFANPFVPGAWDANQALTPDASAHSATSLPSAAAYSSNNAAAGDDRAS